MDQTFDHSRLKSWFKKEKRDFPWREDPQPYSVWVSEIMLQQTRAEVVIPYFIRWMESFPTIEALAKAPPEQVIKQWEGLGYYSRARNLQKGAQWILEFHSGELPQEEEELTKIPGIGPYTLGAIQSFAFKKRAAAVDGNVMRFLARYFKLSWDLSQSRTAKRFREKTLEILPEQESWLVMEAMIEMGATFCTPKANCPRCPVKKSCQAYAEDAVSELPVKSKKIKIQDLFRLILVPHCGGDFLLQKVPEGKVMAGLHEFPFLNLEKEDASADLAKKAIVKEFRLIPLSLQELPRVRHTFTRYRAQLFPFMMEVEKRVDVPGWTWVPYEDMIHLPFSSGHRRILREIQKEISE